MALRAETTTLTRRSRRYEVRTLSEVIDNAAGRCEAEFQHRFGPIEIEARVEVRNVPSWHGQSWPTGGIIVGGHTVAMGRNASMERVLFCLTETGWEELTSLEQLGL